MQVISYFATNKVLVCIQSWTVAKKKKKKKKKKEEEKRWKLERPSNTPVLDAYQKTSEGSGE